MPFETRPSDVKAIIPSPTGGVCEKFLRAITGFPRFFHSFLADMLTEQGELSTNFRTMVCALGCANSGGPANPNLAAPTGVNATDGAFADKVRVSWNAVATATSYKVYRSLSTNTDPNAATLIATVTAPTVLYDDEDAVAGTTYNYWLKSLTATETSAFSAYDVGSADAPSGDIDAITDLRASFGFGNVIISLDWTPPAGAVSYDVYRGTTPGDFGDATLIYADLSPAPTTSVTHPTNDPPFWDNIERVVLYDTPPSAASDYSYWIIAKKTSPPATSLESNEAIGRVDAPAIYNLSNEDLEYTTGPIVVPGGATKMWAVVRGSGAGGAGGSQNYGGGGGGAGAIVREAFTVSPGDTIELIVTGGTPNTGRAARESDGDDGGLVELEINAAVVISIPGALGGVYSASGGGAGGAGGTGTGDTAPVIYDGQAGEAASGSTGGRSGHAFGSRRVPQGDPFGIFDGNGPNGGAPGSGSKAVPIDADLAEGGYGTPGRAFIVFGS